MKKLLAILLVLALSLGMLPMALADEPTVLTIGSIITKRDLDKNVLIQRIAEKLNAKIEFTYYDTDQYSVMLTDGTLPDIMLSKYEVNQLKSIIHKYDPNAFIVVNEGVSVDGNYLKKL